MSRTTAASSAVFVLVALSLGATWMGRSTASRSTSWRAAATEDQQTERWLAAGDRALAQGFRRPARRDWRNAAAGRGRAAGEALTRLLDLNRATVYLHWLRAESPHFVLLTPPGAGAAQLARQLLEKREATWQRLADRLGVRPDGRISVFVYLSNRQGRSLLGRSLAYADPERLEIHVRRDQEPGHEEAHVFAWCWNHRGSGVPFLEEGLAVALSAHPGNPHAAAAEILARGTLPPLGDLVENFRQYRNGYPLAGSFIADLLERHPVGMIRELYTGPAAGEGPDFLSRLEAATGQSMERLQERWETRLGAFGLASYEAVSGALTMLGVGHTRQAIALLETEEQRQPGNPVVTYALACARRDSGDLRGAAAAFEKLLQTPLPYRLAWMDRRAREALADIGPLEADGTKRRQR